LNLHPNLVLEKNVIEPKLQPRTYQINLIGPHIYSEVTFWAQRPPIIICISGLCHRR